MRDGELKTVLQFTIPHSSFIILKAYAHAGRGRRRPVDRRHPVGHVRDDRAAAPRVAAAAPDAALLRGDVGAGGGARAAGAAGEEARPLPRVLRPALAHPAPAGL